MNAMKNTILSLMLIFVIIAPAYSNDVQEGKKLAFDRKKGNCLACHMIDDGELACNSGPPLIAMKLVFQTEMSYSIKYGIQQKITLILLCHHLVNMVL